jgi:uncharacterized protein (DUF1697 family)
MAALVFFRAGNVGGHQVFQPAALAKQLGELGVVNLGAAGTFVVRENVTAAKLRDEILSRLPFKPELLICPAQEVLNLLKGDFFRGEPTGDDIGRFVTIMEKPPKNLPALPLEQPPGGKWEVRLVAVSGRFVLSVRRVGKTYPNALVEKRFKVPATTRGWHTFMAIGKILEK